jgi:hypothetical protein
MMLELAESEDFADHSPIIDGFNVFKQHTIVGGWPIE